MRAISTAIMTLSLSVWATFARADEPQPRLVTESDTGIVFGDLDCQIVSHTATAPRFYADEFDYLSVQVGIETECVTRTGRHLQMRGYDSVIFPTLRFSWVDQAWYHGTVLIASRVNALNIELNPDLEFGVWTDEQESHVSFKVEVRDPDAP